MRSEDFTHHIQNIGLLVLLVVLVAMVLLNFWRGRQSKDRSNGTGEGPEDTLKRRYSKGEIDRETCQRMLSDLRG